MLFISIKGIQKIIGRKNTIIHLNRRKINRNITSHHQILNVLKSISSIIKFYQNYININVVFFKEFATYLMNDFYYEII